MSINKIKCLSLIAISFIISFISIGSNPSYAATPEDIKNVRESIEKLDKNYKDTRIIPTGDSPFFLLVNQENEKIYMTKDAEYVIVGNVFKNVENKSLVDLEQRVLARHRKDILNQLDKDNFVLFKDKTSETKTDLIVFSDISCPFCQKKHNNLDNILEAGFDVYYVPYPRNGMNDTKTVNGLKKIICSKNPQRQYDKAFENPKRYMRSVKDDETQCDKASLVKDYYELGNILGVKGTPATYLPNGFSISGFNSLNQFMNRLLQEYQKYQVLENLGHDKNKTNQ